MWLLLILLLILPVNVDAGIFSISAERLNVTTNKSQEQTIPIKIWLSTPPKDVAAVQIAVIGGRFNRDYTFSGNVVKAGSDFFGELLVFNPGEMNKTVMLKAKNNGYFEPDRKITIRLANPSVGHTVLDRNIMTVKIFDDTVPKTDGHRNIVSVLTPNLDFDTKGFYDRGLPAATGDGVTDDTAAIQAVSDWVYNHGGGVVYFPGPAKIPGNAMVAEKVND